MPSRSTPAHLSTAAALCGWLAVILALNLTDHPLIAGGAFVGLAWLAIRAGQRRLLAAALVLGLSLAVLTPLVMLLAGTPPDLSAIASPTSGPGMTVLLVSCALLRVPAQVLAIVLLCRVPPVSLILAIARVSPRSAVMASMGARLVPMLSHDVRMVQDELRTRGVPFGRGTGHAVRARAWLLLWEASLGTVFERAFATAASLETRGYGCPNPNRAPLTDPRLALDNKASRAAGAAVICSSAILVGGVIYLRFLGLLGTPSFDVLAGVGALVDPLTLLLVVPAAVIGAAPALAHSHPAARASRELPATRNAAAPVRPRPSARTAGAVELRGIVATYPAATLPALTVEQLTIEAGSFVVLAGVAGAGKSTLLDVISGVMPASSGGNLTGSIQWTSHDAHEQGRSAGAVFQDPERQVVVGVVAEEVAFGLRNLGLPIAEIEERTLWALQLLGMLPFAQRRCETLSGGELQRVMLAAALARRPALLVLDEPTSQLDPVGVAAFWGAVEQLRGVLGMTVVTSEHLLEVPMASCDRVLTLHDGRIAIDTRSGTTQLASPDPFVGLQPPQPRLSVPPRLTLRGLGVQVGTGAARCVVARDLHLELVPGSVLALEGANGAGKSTLLRAIRGLHAHNGEVRIDGRPVATVEHEAATFGYVSQHAGPMQFESTVLRQAQPLAAAARVLGYPNVAAAATHHAIGQAGLADALSLHPMDLSVGQRQRLAIVGATAHRPPIWLLDEPTRGMDPVARRWLAQLILEHAAAGGVIVIATHDAALVAAVASHRHRVGDDQACAVTAATPHPPVNPSTAAARTPGGVS